MTFLRQKYHLDKDTLRQINLVNYAYLISNEEYSRYFCDIDFREHYRLLYHLANLFHDSVLFDVGTNIGLSALALALPNKSNLIVTFDIVDRREHIQKILNSHKNIEFIQGNATDDKRLSSSPLVLLDTNHDGIFENYFYNHLKRIGFKGLLLLDDIHLNLIMEKFWYGISEDKEDLTDLGHWSGSGLVDFS